MFFPGRIAKRTNVVKLRKTGRVAYLMPWVAIDYRKPWPEGYSRVFIPFTSAEMKNRKRATFNAAHPDKRGHVQVVRNGMIDFNVAT
jgi:hypothetical protein